MEFSDLRTRAEAGRIGFQVSQDPFSTRITHPDDPLFWIRVEQDLSGRVRITDAVRAGFSPAEMAVALAHILEIAGAAMQAQLVFQDVGMTEAEAEAEFRPVLGLLAKRRGCFVGGLTFTRRQEKMDMTVLFAA